MEKRKKEPIKKYFPTVRKIHLKKNPTTNGSNVCLRIFQN